MSKHKFQKRKKNHSTYPSKPPAWYEKTLGNAANFEHWHALRQGCNLRWRWRCEVQVQVQVQVEVEGEVEVEVEVAAAMTIT
jgi:hypothetical protein